MEKETVTMFDFEAAFKALDEIDIPSISGKGRCVANRVNLSERLHAKEAHEVLIEEYFDVNDQEDLGAAKEEREAEVAKAKLARIEKIVDLDAESEEDILPSYVGKVIMQCPQCMTLFYKNEEDIETSEETPEVVNINEICQHCGNASGYTLIGKVGGIEESEVDNFDLDEMEVDEDELDLDFPEEGTEEIDAEGTGEAGEAMEDEDFDDLDLDLDFDEEDEEEEVEESLHNSELLKKIEDKNDLKSEEESEHLTLNEEVETPAEEATAEVEESLHNSEALEDAEKKSELKSDIESENLTLNEGVEDTQVEEEIEKSTEDAPIEEGIEETSLDSFEVFIDYSGSGEQARKATEPVEEFIAQHPEADVNVQSFDDWKYSEPLAAAKAGKKVVIFTDDDYKTNCPELEDFDNVKIINVMQENLKEGLGDWYRKTFDRPASSRTQQEWEDELNGEFGEISDKRRKELEDKFARQRDWEARHPDKVKDVPTIKPRVEVEAEIKEPVTVESLNEDADNADALLDDLWSGPQPTEEEIEGILDGPRFEEAFEDAEDLDEESINKHLTEYFTSVYSNVATFEATGCNMSGKKLVLEGKIKFNSGKEKATKFVFESTERGIVGINEDFAAHEAFRLSAKVENKTLMTESFKYCYKVDGSLVKGSTNK